jgi:Spy/CpxP family protein refolding chaperone
MNRSNQQNTSTSEIKLLTKEDNMKINDIKKKRTGKYAIFTILATGFLIIIFGLIAQPLMAKGKGRFGPKKSPDEIVQTLTDRLNLSAEQVESILPIIEEKSLLMQEIRDKNGANRKEARSEMHRLQLDTDMQLGRILTDEQVDKYLELKQEQREMRHAGNGQGGKMRGQFNKTPEQEIERLSTILDLTEEQTVQIEPIIKESMEKRQEVFDKYRDQGQQVRQAMRSEMQAIGDETHKQLSTILTAEQMEELNSLKEERRAKMEKRMDRPGHMGF